MTESELLRLLDLVANGDDEQSLLTRKLIGEHLVTLAQSGDVDGDGEIIDQALLGRLRRAIGSRSDAIDPQVQLHLALAYHLEGLAYHLKGRT